MADKLTDSFVKELKPERASRIYYDEIVKGFGVRVTAAGTKAFVLTYRTRSGRERRYTIGRALDWKTTAAREEAKRLKGQIKVNGADPCGELEAERDAPTVSDLATRYVKEHAPKKRTGDEDDRIFAIHVLPTFGRMKVAEVTFADCDGLHRKITSKGKAHRANRAIALLSKAFNLSIQWGWRSDNPCKGIERNPEEKRTRHLSGDEIVRLTKALTEYEDQDAANAVMLLLLTGARRGEVLSARWDQFDLKEGVWIKPGATTKQKTEHRVPLSAHALKLLKAIRAKADDAAEHVFPGRLGGHRVDLKKPWPAICKAAKISGVRLHDLRHTYASLLASAGFSLPMIGALLGHTQPGTTARYAHLFDDPLRKATERVGAIVSGKAQAKIAPVRRAR